MSDGENIMSGYLDGLRKTEEEKLPGHFHVTDFHVAQGMLRPRKRFSNKGDYGTGGLVAGSEGMMGAAVLCATSFIRSGAGKLICHIPRVGYDVMQVCVPEAMAKVEPGRTHIVSVSSLKNYDALGVGPGIGSYASHGRLLTSIFREYRKPLVIDADGLNALSKNTGLFASIPPESVLTPHPREFERLFGATKSERERIDLAIQQACKLRLTIVVKGALTLVATSDGIAHFNTTGNSGLATGGTGDVLTGIITGLVAQGYRPADAAILGVYLHGLAGDLAAADSSEEALIAGDVTKKLGAAFRMLQTSR